MSAQIKSETYQLGSDDRVQWFLPRLAEFRNDIFVLDSVSVRKYLNIPGKGGLSQDSVNSLSEK